MCSSDLVGATFADGTFVAPAGSITGIPSRAAKPGETILVFGIGFGGPSQQIGQISGSNSLVSGVSFTIGGVNATTNFSGLAPGLVGLYQFNVVVPNVAANAAAPLTFAVGGVSSSQALVTAVGN